MAYPFTGIDHRNYGRAGVCLDPAVFAEKCYRQGWRSLHIGDEDGNEVGGIGTSNDHPRRRIWWGAETTAWLSKRQED